jgi:hypothetical protein
MSQAVSPPRGSSLPLGVMPRGLSRIQAAEYVGVSPTLRRMPKPARCGRRVLWDRRQIDRALDGLFNEQGSTENAPVFAV